MATLKQLIPTSCDEKGCERSATQIVMRGDNGPVVGHFCGAHSLKQLRAAAKADGKAKA